MQLREVLAEVVMSVFSRRAARRHHLDSSPYRLSSSGFDGGSRLDPLGSVGSN